MTVTTTKLEGVLIIDPEVHGDERGYFFESFNQREFDALVAPVRFVQDNESKSCYGVVRGLHYQKGASAQAKLLRVIRGRVLDVAVDLRKASKTFGKYVAVELSGENHRQLFIPRGFAHGFSTLSEEVVFTYKCDNFYDPSAECGIAWNDPTIGIDWGISPGEVILSEKDRHRPTLKTAKDLF